MSMGRTIHATNPHVAQESNTLSVERGELRFTITRAGDVSGPSRTHDDALDMSEGIRHSHMTLAHVAMTLRNRGWRVAFVPDMVARRVGK